MSCSNGSTFAISYTRAEIAAGGGFHLNLPCGLGGVGLSKGTKDTVSIPPPVSLAEALDVIRYVARCGWQVSPASAGVIRLVPLAILSWD
jgi:hypothetical protein